MQDSVFTKIIKREIPAEILYEDDLAIIILTIEPHNNGHSLIVPKQQIENWEDLPEDLFLYLMKLLKSYGLIIKEVYKPEKLGIATVGFEVPHVHIHLIPIYNTSDMDQGKAKKASPEVLAIEAAKIRKLLKDKNIRPQ